MRINKYIAGYLGVSRRQADSLIEKGEILYNGALAEVGNKVAEKDEVCYKKDNRWVLITPNTARTSLHYKPIFTLVSTKSEGNKKTIYERLPPRYRSFKTAGRLDYMSEGLLVLSEDGDLIHELTHPRHDTRKKYVVGLTVPLQYTHLNKLCKGVTIDNYRLRPVKITPLDAKTLDSWAYLRLDPRQYWYEFTLQEGRNNQIRKMCRLFDYKITRLIRTAHGPYTLTPELKKNKIIDL